MVARALIASNVGLNTGPADIVAISDFLAGGRAVLLAVYPYCLDPHGR
jgi:hypothetical protein